MNHHKNLKERYIQLVEAFIAALESGKSGAELADIRNEIRTISVQLSETVSVENGTQTPDIISPSSKDETAGG